MVFFLIANKETTTCFLLSHVIQNSNYKMAPQPNHINPYTAFKTLLQNGSPGYIFETLFYWKKWLHCGPKAHQSVAEISTRMQNTPAPDHFWAFRCRFAWQAQGIVHLVKNEQNVRILFQFQLQPPLHHTTPHYTTTTTTTRLHYTQLHYTTMHGLQLQLQLQMHYITLH